MNDNTQLFMIRAKLETLKITLQDEPLTSIVQDIQDDIIELIHENNIKYKSETPSKEDEVDTKKIKECMDKIVKNMGLTYELYNEEYTIDSTTKTQSNYLKDLFKDYR